MIDLSTYKTDTHMMELLKVASEDYDVDIVKVLDCVNYLCTLQHVEATIDTIENGRKELREKRDTLNKAIEDIDLELKRLEEQLSTFEAYRQKLSYE